ncbi:hypothetical protein GCM10008931_33910 [Oceanobacillus oncorhynchi subsp. oncorhynchi]
MAAIDTPNSSDKDGIIPATINSDVVCENIRKPNIKTAKGNCIHSKFIFLSPVQYKISVTL